MFQKIVNPRTAPALILGTMPLSWFYRDGRATALGRAFSSFWATWAGLGLPPRRQIAFEVKGRHTGRTHTIALVVAKHAGQEYLVSMVGEGQWVKNIRAAGGEAFLVGRGRRRRRVRLEPVPLEQRAAIIQEYLRVAPGARPHIGLDPNAPLADFQCVALKYPVFRIEYKDAAQQGEVAGFPPGVCG